MIMRFVIYGFLGWGMEIIWTGLNSIQKGELNLMGHTSLWMFFIYGSAVFLLEPIYRIILGFNWFYRGLIWVALIFLIEFLSGSLLKLMGIKAWHYTSPLSVFGLIRLDYAPLWFVVGLLFEKAYLYLRPLTER